MREDPGLDVGKIAACLNTYYDLQVASVAFLPVGYDPNAAVYEVVSRDGTSFFSRSGSAPSTSPACWCRGR